MIVFKIFVFIIILAVIPFIFAAIFDDTKDCINDCEHYDNNPPPLPKESFDVKDN